MVSVHGAMVQVNLERLRPDNGDWIYLPVYIMPGLQTTEKDLSLYSKHTTYLTSAGVIEKCEIPRAFTA